MFSEKHSPTILPNSNLNQLGHKGRMDKVSFFCVKP